MVIVSVGKDDAAPLGPEAAVRRVEEPGHPQAHPAVAERRLALPDALGEMSDHRLERLARLDVGAPDIAGAVADEELAPALGPLAEFDAAVVDLDRLGGVQLVE